MASLPQPFRGEMIYIFSFSEPNLDRRWLLLQESPLQRKKKTRLLLKETLLQWKDKSRLMLIQ